MKKAISVLLALFALSGCFGGHKNEAPACPSIALLPDTDRQTVFSNEIKSADSTVLEARLLAPSVACTESKAGTSATAMIALSVIRGLGFPEGGDVDLAYFVAAYDPATGQLLAKHEDAVRVNFPGNSGHAESSLTSELLLPKDHKASALQLMVGFQLSGDALSYNQSRTH